MTVCSCFKHYCLFHLHVLEDFAVLNCDFCSAVTRCPWERNPPRLPILRRVFIMFPRYHPITLLMSGLGIVLPTCSSLATPFEPYGFLSVCVQSLILHARLHLSESPQRESQIHGVSQSLVHCHTKRQASNLPERTQQLQHCLQLPQMPSLFCISSCTNLLESLY